MAASSSRCRGAARARVSAGFTMLEVLVSILIIVLGLLGLAGMQAVAQQAELESYQRAQALVLLSDMVDRINANRGSAGCFAFTTDTANGTPWVGSSVTSSAGYLGTANCGTGYLNSQTKAIVDAAVAQWNQELQGTSETTASGTAIGAMIGARGCVSFDSTTSIYTVVVTWQGMTELFAPVKACANGLYGTETKRRAVWTTIQIANLS